MFIHASDPERIQKELQQLSYQLADLVKQVDYLTRNIVTTSPRAKQTLPAMFVQEVHRQMSLGIPEDIAVDDARDALDMTKKAAFFYWARAIAQKRFGTIRQNLLLQGFVQARVFFFKNRRNLEFIGHDGRTLY